MVASLCATKIPDRALLSATLLLLVVGSNAYGEGHADVVSRQAPSTAMLRWSSSSEISDCAVWEAGEAEARMTLTLPEDATELSAAAVCINVIVRADTAQAWWFVAPPAAAQPLSTVSLPPNVVFSVPSAHSRLSAVPSQCVSSSSGTSANGTATLHYVLPLLLRAGYVRVLAYLDQPRDSTTPLVPPVDAVVAVVAVPAGRPAWMARARPPARLPESLERSLSESYRIVRRDEEPERRAYAQRTAAGRAAYAPLHAWQPRAAPPSAAAGASSGEYDAALQDVLAPELLAALESPTPKALWRLLETPDASLPVHGVRLFTSDGAARIADELRHAHDVMPARLAQPTNNVSDVVGDAREQRDMGDGTQRDTHDLGHAAPPPATAAEPPPPLSTRQPPSVLLDEVRLDGLASSLAAAVLAPLARLLYPEWTFGGALDSYHAFSIHRRAHAEQDAWFRPSSRSEPGAAEPATADGATHGTHAANASSRGVHSDVCEVSLNVALHVSDDLLGSRVAFERGFASAAAGGARAHDDAAPLWMPHAQGGAFINLCQHRHGVEPLMRGARDTLVVRGFSSAFRRAPAEGWVERCVAPEHGGGTHDEL
jgi:hypothetical protein